MIIYKKIADIQKDLMKNTFKKDKGYHGKYMKLETLLPPIMDKCYEKELTLYFTATTEHLLLKLMSWDGQEEFSARVRLPELTKDEKDEGGYYTYLKRYLLMNTFLVLADSYDPEDFPTNQASSAEETKSSNNTINKSKKDEVRDLNLQELFDKAMDKLQKKGLSIEEITPFAVKKCIEKMDKFNKGELKLIYKFVNDYFDKEASK